MRIISIGLLLLVLGTACHQEGKKQDDSTRADTLESGAVAQISGPKNYQYLQNGDTISLAIDIAGDSVHGNLTYALKEKDKNIGTLAGVVQDSILLADYTFGSEGQTSVRQVAFKLLNDRAIEGYGEMTEKEGKMIFLAPGKLKYSEQFALKDQGAK